MSLNTALELRLEHIAVRCPLEADDDDESGSAVSVPTMPQPPATARDGRGEQEDLEDELATSRSEPVTMLPARAGSAVVDCLASLSNDAVSAHIAAW